jgi:signal transduction histidine kinase
MIPETAGHYDLLRRQQSAIDSASRMLNSLLDITRLESGAIEPHLSPTNLASIFADLQQEFESPALAKGLRLEFAHTSKVVTSDRILLNQLLQNVIGNAIKYTDTGVVNVSESMDSDGLLLSVQDTGRGIPNDKLERIFDEYYQVDQTGSQRSGVGLGLAIVRGVFGCCHLGLWPRHECSNKYPAPANRHRCACIRRFPGTPARRAPNDLLSHSASGG